MCQHDAAEDSMTDADRERGEERKRDEGGL